MLSLALDNSTLIISDNISTLRIDTYDCTYLKYNQIHGIYGIVSYELVEYLILVVESRCVGSIHPMFVKDTFNNKNNINNKSKNSVHEIRKVIAININGKANSTFTDALTQFFSTIPGIYFSGVDMHEVFGNNSNNYSNNHNFNNYDSDIINTYSDIFESNTKERNHNTYNNNNVRNNFLFNFHQMSNFIKKYETNLFLLKCIQGYYNYDSSTNTMIVSRRCIGRLGTRMQCRGADISEDTSNNKDNNNNRNNLITNSCANMVETEVIVIYERDKQKNNKNINSENINNTSSIVSQEEKDMTSSNKLNSMTSSSDNSSYYSFLIVRGSIPLLWNQNISYKYSHDIVICNNHSQNITALTQHNNLLSELYPNKEIVYVNLISDKIKGERDICEYFKKTLDELKYKSINYDYHYQNISDINIKEIINNSGKTLFRVNCIDSLDRTNGMQYILCTNDILNNININKYNSTSFVLKELWGENGMKISQQYAGTGALHSKKIMEYEVNNNIKKNNISFIKNISFQDILSSAQRYVYNRTIDYRTNEIYKILDGKEHKEIKKKKEYYGMSNRNIIKILMVLIFVIGAVKIFSGFNIKDNTIVVENNEEIVCGHRVNEENIYKKGNIYKEKKDKRSEPKNISQTESSGEHFVRSEESSKEKISKDEIISESKENISESKNNTILLTNIQNDLNELKQLVIENNTNPSNNNNLRVAPLVILLFMFLFVIVRIILILNCI